MDRETTEDYVAKLNIEGERKVLVGNHPKIEYIFSKSKRYLESQMSICEIGLGDGYLLHLLYEYGIICTGIDISSYIINHLGEVFKREGKNIDLLQHDIANTIPFKNTFDAVYCIDIIEHIQNLDDGIKNIITSLKQDGLLIATLPWKENMSKNMTMCPQCHHKFHRIGHFHSFQSYKDILQILGKNFHILKFNFIPPFGFQNVVKSLIKKTFLRGKYYKNGKPKFLNTCYFIARVIK